MPHYKDGSPAKVGDLIIHEDQYSKASALGILVSIIPATDTCNGNLLPVARKWPGSSWLPVTAHNTDYVTLKDSLPVASERSTLHALPAYLTEASAPLPDPDPQVLETGAAPQGDGDPRAPEAT